MEVMVDKGNGKKLLGNFFLERTLNLVKKGRKGRVENKVRARSLNRLSQIANSQREASNARQLAEINSSLLL